MKKSLYFAMFAAVALASCSSNDSIEEIAEDEVEIGFTGEAQKSTRAEITSNANLATEGGFVVYGYKATTATPMDWTANAYTVFDAVNVKSSGNSGAYIEGTSTNWTYDTKKYWDKNASYCFYAVAPYNPTDNARYSVSGNNNAKMITIDGASSGLASASDDYLISRAGVIDRKGTVQSNVDFTFNHTMAKVDFLLVKSSGVTGTLKVQNITMTGWNSGKGKFVQASTSTPSGIEKSEWTIATSGTSNAEVLKGADTEVTTTAAACGTNTYIMVPQEIAADALTFTIDYTIDNEPFKAHVGTVSTLQTWGTDSHITYTLTLGPAAIEFDVVSVAGFTNTGTGSADVQ